MVVKKYGNRRLYDTEASSYITLDQLAQSVRSGKDVQVVDAKTGRDLTQVTLAQIILESRGASRLLPVPLLLRLIRMGDDALAEFFGRYMSWALEVYLQAKQGAQAVAPYNPFAALPFGGPAAFAQMFGIRPPFADQVPAPEPIDISEDPPPPSDLADLRRELEELKQAISAAKEEK